MSKKKKLGLLAGSTAVTTATAAHAMKKEADKTTYTAELMSAIKPRKMGFYEKYIKRGMDVICASAAILCFSPIYAGVALLVKIKLGSPVIFTQDRPGLVDKNGRETIFKMYKFRTMTDERDEEGNLLPDEVRLTKFGAWLRKTMAVDIVQEKVEKINKKISPIQDEYIEKYLKEKQLNLTATLDAETAYKDADFVVIAAPTNYDCKETLIHKNAVAIMMPYLRSEVSLLTSQPETNSIVMPIFNINKMIK